MSTIKKKKDNNKYIVIVVIIAIIMITTMCIIIRLITKNSETQSNSTIPVSSQNSNNNIEVRLPKEEEKNEIKTMSEQNRMKRYIGIFFEDIEEGKYEEAYNVLNEEFKSNYFPTLEKFIEYANKNFKSSMAGVTYDNIERLGNDKTGNMYVLWLTVYAAKNTKIETNFVIIENNYNDYEMSFSVNL